MSLRDSQTETWRHSDVTVSGLGPLLNARQTLIPTPHNSPFCLVENGHLPGDSSEAKRARDGGGPNGPTTKRKKSRMVRNHGAGLLEDSPTRASPEPQVRPPAPCFTVRSQDRDMTPDIRPMCHLSLIHI